MLRIPFLELRETLTRALTHLGLPPARAALSARLIAETDLNGVATHGTARFPRFADMVASGAIDPRATPSLTKSLGAIERWSGNLGPGNAAAHDAMERAMQLAAQNGIGAVALANTNHWQRGGSYGWQAANAGFAAICWTNTLPNLPPWGATTPAVGNNPLVIAVPHIDLAGASRPIVLDMAMSQFSYGTLAAYRERSESLPVPGGYDTAGQLTTIPAEIEATQRALPVGFWKGSGLAFALDMLGALLAEGRATHEIPAAAELETGVTQVFLTMSPAALAGSGGLRNVVEEAISAFHAATPIHPGTPVRYPGEHIHAIREANLRDGVPVAAGAWKKITDLSAAKF